MANDYLETYLDLYTDAMDRIRISTTNSTVLTQIKRLLNIAYDDIVADHPWDFLVMRERVINVFPYYDTGTVAVTQDSATVTGSSTAWTTAFPGSTTIAAGDYFKADGHDEIYQVKGSIAAGSLQLGNADAAVTFKGSTDAETDYKIWRAQYALPSDFKRLLNPTHAFYPYTPHPEGLRGMRAHQRGPSNTLTDDPHYYALVTDESGAWAIIVWPIPDSRVTLYYDYIRNITYLSADADEPLLPISYRAAIVHKALKDYFTDYQENLNKATLHGREYDLLYARMKTNFLTEPTQDKPRLELDDSEHRRLWWRYRAGRSVTYGDLFKKAGFIG